MEPLVLFSAVAIGFVGSFHCVAMCGPIALSLPYRRGQAWLSPWLYNLGRVTGYSFLGIAAGMFHQAAVFAGLQKWISLIAGVGLLLFLLGKGEQRFWRVPLLRKGLQRLQARMSAYLKQGRRSAFFQIGLLNSFLPCGFVYLGLAAASTQTALLSSMTYMTAFGIGTVPAMLGMTLLGARLQPGKYPWLAPALNGLGYLVALLLIVRG
ncbi:MAG: sulfite exporter TauE/SafE family protein, partial [Bacteroidota bacterium]